MADPANVYELIEKAVVDFGDKPALRKKSGGRWTSMTYRQYRDHVRDIAALVGVDVDAAEPDSSWDDARGRTEGHPDEHAVERARGDRNRALFVE